MLVATTVLLALLACALVYSALSIAAALAYRSVHPPRLDSAPPISILKPLAGLDLDLEDNLRSFFEQNYPNFEILFAVRNADDPALPVVERLRDFYPQVTSRVLLTGEPPYSNAKVYSLDRMLTAASHDLVVMSDSDTSVSPDLLQTVGAEFQDSSVSIATCPYRAVSGPSFWSRIEATGLNTNFMAGILVARLIEGMRFAVGPTIVARRQVLQSLGGFDRLKDYLAEDFVLGKVAARAGYGVMLSSHVIDHHIGNASFEQNMEHRLRWARSTRRSRPMGYFGQLLTMPFPLAILAGLTRPTFWPIIPLTFAVRALAAYFVAGRTLRARINWLLLPLEDLAGFGFWLAGFFGNTILWRGRRYRLYSDGRFELLTPAHPPNS